MLKTRAISFPYYSHFIHYGLGCCCCIAITRNIPYSQCNEFSNENAFLLSFPWSPCSSTQIVMHLLKCQPVCGIAFESNWKKFTKCNVISRNSKNKLLGQCGCWWYGTYTVVVHRAYTEKWEKMFDLHLMMMLFLRKLQEIASFVVSSQLKWVFLCSEKIKCRCTLLYKMYFVRYIQWKWSTVWAIYNCLLPAPAPRHSTHEHHTPAQRSHFISF